MSFLCSTGPGGHNCSTSYPDVGWFLSFMVGGVVENYFSEHDLFITGPSIFLFFSGLLGPLLITFFLSICINWIDAGVFFHLLGKMMML